MYIVANRVPIAAPWREQFEERFRTRAGQIDTQPGFVRLQGFCRKFSLGTHVVYDLPLRCPRTRRGGETMVSFKGAHFAKDILLVGVRWYVAYPLSYRHGEGGFQPSSGVFSSDDYAMPLADCMATPCWRID